MAAGVEETSEGAVGPAEAFYRSFRAGDMSCFDLLGKLSSCRNYVDSAKLLGALKGPDGT